MTRLPALLLLLAAACAPSAQVAPAPLIDSVAPAPRMLRAMARPAGAVTADTSRTSDTTRWADTTKPNDSTLAYNRGTSIQTTVTVRTSTTVTSVDATTLMRLSRPVLGIYAPKASPPFASSISMDTPEELAQKINQARANGRKLVLAMTGGSHERYKSDGRFYYPMWKEAQARYNTSAIKSAISQGVADGTVIGASLMDEPNHADWGMIVTKARLDEMARYTKSIFPTLPVGFTTGPRGYLWQPAETLHVVDFWVSQYNKFIDRMTGGDHTTWLKLTEARAKVDGVSLILSVNILDGGPAAYGVDADAWENQSKGCLAGRGTYYPTCRVTPAELKTWGLLLAQSPMICGMMTWREDAAFLQKPENQQALTAIAAQLRSRPFTACRRRV